MLAAALAAAIGIGTSAATGAEPKALLSEIPAPVGPPVAGKVLKSASDEVAVVSRAQGQKIGIPAAFPDVHPTYLRFDDGSIRFWIQGGGGTSTFTTTDFTAFTPTPNAAAVTHVLAPSKPLSAAFDADYAGGSSVFPSADKKDLLLIYHAENHYGRPYGSSGVTAFYATVGIARSSDGGKTWTPQGPILSGRETMPAYPPPATAMGAGNPSAIITAGYIYVFYLDMVSKTGPYKGINALCLARAPITSDGAVGAWMKYYQKAFSQPGIGGECNAAVPPPTAKSGISFQSNPDISFNTALNAYLLVFQSDDGFFYSTSPDMVTWTVPKLFMETPPNVASLRTAGADYYYYPLLVTPAAPSDQITGASGFVYYAKGTEDAKLTQSTHSWYRRSWTIE
jgi:hypothetical protein